MKSSRLLTPVLALMLVLALRANGATPSMRRILILHAYHEGLSWTDTIEASIRAKLAEQEPLEISTEYLDCKRHPYEQIAPTAATYLATKYAQTKPALILCSDNPALRFLEHYKAELFGNVPVVFCGINFFTKADRQRLGPQYTGVAEIPDIAGTVRLIRQLQPQTRKLYIISGAAPTSIMVQAEAQRELEPLKAELIPIWWNKLSMKELLPRLRQLKPSDAVLLLAYNLDPEGPFLNFHESAEQITRNTPAPVYGLWDFYLNHGIVGGRLISGQDQGFLAAELALKILRSGKIPAPIMTHPYQTIFDYPAMKKHHLNPTLLPKDARLLSPAESPHWLPLIFFAIGISLALITLLSVAAMLRPWCSKKRVSLTSVFRQSLLGMVGTMAVGIMLLLLFTAHANYRQEMRATQQRLTLQKREQMQADIQDAISYIAYQRIAERERIEQQLRQRTQEAVTLARHLYRRNAQKSYAEISAIIRESLSGIRWAKDYGYYFALNLNGEMQVHPLHPDMVGQNYYDLQDPNGVFLIQQFIQIAQTKSHGISHYLWQKSSDPDAPYVQKTTHIRLFKPLNWIIGTGYYEDDLIRATQEQVLSRLASLRFEHQTAPIFILDRAGRVLLNPPHLPDGTPLDQELAQATTHKSSPFIEHRAPGTQTVAALSYSQLIEDWGWIIGTTRSMDDVQANLSHQKEQLQTQLLQQSLIILSTGMLAFAAMLYLSRRIAIRVGRELTSLLDGTEDRSCYRSLLASQNYRIDELHRIAQSTRNAFNALIATELNLQTYFDASPDFVFILDKEENIMHTNLTVPNRLGYTEKELQGNPLLFVFPPLKQRMAARQLRSIITGKTDRCMIPLQTKEGRLIETETILQQGAWNGTPALFGISRDISDIRRSEERLRTERERLSNLIFATHAGTWEWDILSGRVIINGRWAEILGYTIGEINPLYFDTFRELIHPDDLAHMEQKIQRHFSGEETYYQAEYRMRHKEGHWCWIESSGRITQYNDQDHPLQMSGTHADITNRKEAEIRLNQLSNAVEQNPASVVITNANGNIEYVNPKFEKITGYSRSDVLGQNPRLLKASSHPSTLFKNLWETITAGHVWRGELHNKKKNGDLFWEMATISPLRNKDGQITNFIAIKEDITERKRMEEQLQQTLAETEQMNQLMTAREMRVLEMKREINQLLTELNRPPKYSKGL